MEKLTRIELSLSEKEMTFFRDFLSQLKQEVDSKQILAQKMELALSSERNQIESFDSKKFREEYEAFKAIEKMNIDTKKFDKLTFSQNKVDISKQKTNGKKTETNLDIPVTQMAPEDLNKVLVGETKSLAEEIATEIYSKVENNEQ